MLRKALEQLKKFPRTDENMESGKKQQQNLRKLYLLDLAEEAGTTVLFAKRISFCGPFARSMTIDLQSSVKSIGSSEESGLIDLSSPRRHKEPEESQADHEEFRSGVFDFEEVVSDATALSSPQKAQETDGIQEAAYSQDTEETEESEVYPEDDDQCKPFLPAENTVDDY
ncbi:hypothetical protein BCON_0274g00060 [Botryotinia convoluta]|uniref:Uncharacterized protein n=1 Tax=Botryotinia convoluta TaxID=54673 RepID=A0A4Z1HRF5_9HELO|nr:hypothetical protein BCON_0274g00060 [Botryotinia convoluta]